jgi:uncharacterized protein (UPF0332 family)
MLLYIPFLIVVAVATYFATPYILNVSLMLPEIDPRSHSAVKKLAGELSQLTSSIEKEVQRYKSEVVKINSSLNKLKSVSIAKTLSPLKCYEQKREKKIIKAPKKQKTLLKFSYTIPLEITALMDGRKVAVIAGHLFKEGDAKVIDVSGEVAKERVYIKVLRIEFNRAKVYVAPVNFKRKGKVVWLRRGENTVNISFYY